jgi:hypothetical protein
MRARSVGFVLSALVLLLAPGMGSAQVQVMGSPFVNQPNVSIGCEAKPIIADTQGNFGLFASGVPDCTWRQSGVFGVVSGDTRFSSVPGDGRIIRVDVLSGPNPAPLRFAIFRQLQTPGFGGLQQCCFFVGESQTVQPTPGVSSFLVDLPVVRNTINGYQAVDLIGISAGAGTGSLPLHSTGRNNSFQLTEFGSVNAGFFYPRLGADPNDVGGGRREDGIPGIEVLIQWTWCPAAAGGTGPGVCGVAGGGGGGGAAGPALRSQTLPVANGQALADLICNGNAVCRGQLALLAAGGRTAGAITAAKVTLFGQRKFKLQPGATTTLKLKLNAKGKRLLKASTSATVTARITPKGGTAFTVPVTLAR